MWKHRASVIQDPATGMSNQTFRTPYTAQHKIGGFVPVRISRWFIYSIFWAQILDRILLKGFPINFRVTESNSMGALHCQVARRRGGIGCTVPHNTCKVSVHDFLYSPIHNALWCLSSYIIFFVSDAATIFEFCNLTVASAENITIGLQQVNLCKDSWNTWILCAKLYHQSLIFLSEKWNTPKKTV